MRRLSTYLLAGLVCLSMSKASSAQANDPRTGEDRLRFESSVTRDDLTGLNSVTISPDGRFLYATPWQIGAVVVFERDMAKGSLKHVHTLKDARLAGDTAVELNPAGDRAVAACFQSSSAVLMRRDAKSGRLSIIHAARNGEDDVTGLAFAIDAIFSPDGKFVYVLDGGSGGIATFAVRDDQLVWLNAMKGVDDCLAGSRGVALDPKGETMYVTSHEAGTLTVLKRDGESGSLKVQQVITDEEDDAHGLAGAFGVVCSRDGQFIYTTSGRFRGDSSIGVFRRKNDGMVEVVQEFIAGLSELTTFRGGNRVALTPDEKNLYAVGSLSGSLACFQRDSQSGRLKLVETLVDGHDQGVLGGAAGIAVSPDGKFVYIAAEAKNTISIYRRN